MSRFKKYLATEVGIDYKACIYTYCILFYIAVYQVLQHNYSISILIIAEVLAVTYLMGYLQVYVMHNFDESDHFGKREFLDSLICSLLYLIVSYVGNWFDRNMYATGIFFFYMLMCFWSLYLANKIKRSMETRELNQYLKEFKQNNENDMNHK